MSEVANQGPLKAAKQALLQLLVSSGFPASFKYVQRHCATIFMLHRFRDPELGVAGFDAQRLRETLGYLTRQNYELIGLVELFDRLAGNGPEPRGAVAFTIDDGYRDHATIAAPIFAEYRCPVTTFVTTGFLDRLIWFWWDQIEYIFSQTHQTSARVDLGGASLEYHWTNQAERDHARDDFVERCKAVPHDEKNAAIARLALAAGVDIPKTAPARYAPMTWDQLRACEDMGMTFGPHTVTHPVLSRMTAEQAKHELTESWNRLRAEARRPVPIFCYPNGRWEDFGDREIAILREQGISGAVAGVPGYADAALFRRHQDGPFKVKRFSLPESLPHTAQYATGIEHFKRLWRGET